MTNLWSLLALIGLGAFHGLNPAMGWLFAVALGLYRKSRQAVLIALIPIALGHAAAIAVVVYAVMGLGAAIDAETFRLVAGGLLVAWGLYHLLYGHRHRVRIGLSTGISIMPAPCAVAMANDQANRPNSPVRNPICRRWRCP
jgi:hypothetical protein